MGLGRRPQMALSFAAESAAVESWSRGREATQELPGPSLPWGCLQAGWGWGAQSPPTCLRIEPHTRRPADVG